ncbi:DUF1203 domain-containing protein [Sphingomonas tabacisoli]|uniref:DUF1203 domain-containing protein n=1 Tax=Sphingomonas tabacisoli TaxID=2249466 RepID=A0ABW4I2C7_9SPHN
MAFRIAGLDPEAFLELAYLSDGELADRGIIRRISSGSGFPCRVTLAEVPAGEAALLMNYEHQPAGTPFRASHAIFVREGAGQRFDRIDEVPELFRTRLLSIRAFDAEGMMVEADVVDGKETEAAIERFFAAPATDYLHIHYAKPGCFAARVDRA